jgi:hypothetical protein
MGFNPSPERVNAVICQRLIALGLCFDWRTAKSSVIVSKRSRAELASQLVLFLMGWREIIA